MTLNGYQKACLATFVALVAYWATLYATGTTEGPYNSLFIFLYGLIPLVGGLVAIFGIKAWGGFSTVLGKGLFMIGLGLFLWGVGESVWAYLDFFQGIDVPYPSLADLFFAPSIVLYVTGPIFLAQTTGAGLGWKSAFGKIFSILAPAAILGLSYYLFVGDAAALLEDGVSLKTVLDIAYPLLDFVALSVAVIVSGLSFKYLGGAYKYDIISILAGLAAMFVADWILAYTSDIGAAYSGDFGDLAFTVGMFLLTFGALGFAKLKQAPLPQAA